MVVLCCLGLFFVCCVFFLCGGVLYEVWYWVSVFGVEDCIVSGVLVFVVGMLVIWVLVVVCGWGGLLEVSIWFDVVIDYMFELNLFYDLM